MKATRFTFIALACLGSNAMAQSTVTLFGVVDANVTHGRGSIASRTQVGSSGLYSSLIGFRDQEDLGGGMSAQFWLEAGLVNDNATGQASNTNNQPAGAAPALGGGQGLTFNRQSWAGLSAPWGEVRLGRDYTPTFWVHALYDPNVTGMFASQSAIGSLTVLAQSNGVRASNAVSYTTPAFSRWRAQAMYALGENASGTATSHDGDYFGARVYYAEGPLSAGLAHATYKASSVGDIRETVAGVVYAVNALKLHGLYVRNTTAFASNMRGAMLGASYTVGATLFKASVSQSALKTAAGMPGGTTSKLSFAADHRLSKRTSLYFVAARTSNRDSAANTPYPGLAVTAPNESASGYAVGIRHSF